VRNLFVKTDNCLENCGIAVLFNALENCDTKILKYVIQANPKD